MVRINLNISLEKFSEKDITYIKSILKKGKFPSTLNEYRENINSIKNRYNKIISDFKLKHLVLPSVKEFKQLIQFETVNENEIFIELLEKFIEQKREDFVNSPSSIKDFISFKNSILDYQLKNNIIIRIDLIDRNFIRSYFNFLQTKREKNKGYITKGGLDGKTIKKRFDVLKYFTKWYSTNKKDYKLYNEVTTILAEQTFNTSKITSEVKKISLSLDQIKFLQNLELKENTRLCKVRDMFVFVCQTGLRFSDLISMKAEHIEFIDGQYYIHRQSKKTKNKYFKVELSEWTYNVLVKYNFNMNLISNQKSNEYLKELLSNYEIFNNKTKYINTETNKPFLFFEIVSFHQGRRSFITNLLDNGYSIVEVMERTDHTKVSTLEKYVSSKGYGTRNILNLWSK